MTGNKSGFPDAVLDVTPQEARDVLDAATAARVRKDEELDELALQLGEAQLAAQRLEAVMREVAFERDELVVAEDAAFEAFTAAGGQLDPVYRESFYFEPSYAEF